MLGIERIRPGVSETRFRQQVQLRHLLAFEEGSEAHAVGVEERRRTAQIEQRGSDIDQAHQSLDSLWLGPGGSARGQLDCEQDPVLFFSQASAMNRRCTFQRGNVAKEALAARIRFYRELGLTEFYRRPVDPELLVQINTEAESQVSEARPGAPSFASKDDVSEEKETIPPRKTISTPPPIADDIRPADRLEALRIIREDIGDCTRCALHNGRNKLVFADGSPDARLMFVGEGPGADEDAQGLPFVGRAGQLARHPKAVHLCLSRARHIFAAPIEGIAKNEKLLRLDCCYQEGLDKPASREVHHRRE